MFRGGGSALEGERNGVKLWMEGTLYQCPMPFAWAHVCPVVRLDLYHHNFGSVFFSHPEIRHEIDDLIIASRLTYRTGSRTVSASLASKFPCYSSLYWNL